MPTSTALISRMDSGGSLAQWRSVLSQEMSRVDVDGREAMAFSAIFSRKTFASADLILFDIPSLLMRRTASAIRQDNCSYLTLQYFESGEVRFRQYGRSVLVHSGDCLIVDSGVPFELFAKAPCKSLCIKLPRTLISRFLRPEEVAARRIDGASCWGAPLSAYLRALYLDFEARPTISPCLIGEQALQLVELALGEQASNGSTHRKGLLRRIRAALREVYSNEDLTPGMVAAMVGISKGYMHRLFARAGTTFCQELDEIRMGRAAALLETKGQKHLTISEIGIRCGLPHPPHFNRKFRALKGMAPSQYRDLMMGS